MRCWRARPKGCACRCASRAPKTLFANFLTRSVSMSQLTSLPEAARIDVGHPEVPPRLREALTALREGRAVLLLDDDDRENEADLIVAAERLSVETMALLIRECSGIVCLCLPERSEEHTSELQSQSHIS